MQKKINLNRVIYGTARLGNFSYGYSKENILNYDQRESLISKVIELGINRFDTSPQYNDAEIVLGKAITKTKTLIDSKVINLKPGDKNSQKIIFNQVENSLKRLNKENLNVLYLHQNEIEILSDKYIQIGLKKILQYGLAKKIGSSVYSHLEFDYSLESDVFSVIQAPVNILNYSFYKKFILSKKRLSKELVARSIFLQGTLMNVDFKKLSKLNKDLSRTISDLKRICLINETTIINEAKHSVFELNDLSVIQSSLSIDNILSNLHYHSNKKKIAIKGEIEKLRDIEYSFTNPRNWKND